VNVMWVDPTRIETLPSEVVAVIAEGTPTFQEVDRALQRIAARRAVDGEEACWLLIARADAVHVPLGFPSFEAYIKHVLGYGRRALADRMRVAEAMERVPELARALNARQLTYSAVRELSRVVTPGTIHAWLHVGIGRTARQIVQLVAGRCSGDLPDSPRRRERRPQPVRFTVPASVAGLYEQARRHVVAQVGAPLTHAQTLAAICRLALGQDIRPPEPPAPTTAPTSGEAPVPTRARDREAMPAPTRITPVRARDLGQAVPSRPRTEHVRKALRVLGFTGAEARFAVERASTQLKADDPLEMWLREALRTLRPRTPS
jgi:hypothetical protein